VSSGARAPLAWATLLAVLGTINAIWTGDGIQIALFGFAVGAILGLAAGLVVVPARPTGPETVPTVSLAAVVVALGIASIVFGVAFGHFPIYFGAGLVVAGLGRVAVELRAQRRTAERWRRR
jgi:hypothetical protein